MPALSNAAIISPCTRRVPKTLIKHSWNSFETLPAWGALINWLHDLHNVMLRNVALSDTVRLWPCFRMMVKNFRPYDLIFPATLLAVRYRTHSFVSSRVSGDPQTPPDCFLRKYKIMERFPISMNIFDRLDGSYALRTPESSTSRKLTMQMVQLLIPPKQFGQIPYTILKLKKINYRRRLNKARKRVRTRENFISREWLAVLLSESFLLGVVSTSGIFFYEFRLWLS